jgi:hypothetical protein
VQEAGPEVQGAVGFGGVFNVSEDLQARWRKVPLSFRREWLWEGFALGFFCFLYKITHFL